MFTTSDNAFALIELCEGLRLTAHNTWGRWEIGYGQEGKLFPGTPGEIVIHEGLSITPEMASDALRFYVHNVVEPMVRLHFSGCQTQGEFDACVSWTYNIRHDKLNRGEYSLPDVINNPDRSPDAVTAILNKFLLYHKTPGAETGLYRRRILEGIVLMELPWNVPAVLGQLRLIKAGDDPEPVYQAAEAVYDQLTEDEQTAALSNGQLEKLGGKAAEPVPAETPVAKPKAIEVKKVDKPTVDATQEPTLIEKSKTGKAVNRAERGKETTIIGTITGTGVAAAAANAEKVGSIVEKFKPETFMIMGGLLVGFMIIMGGIMWWSGRAEAHWRRQIEQDPKV
jgi:GH24 family phage-related lysozyme (muramidase)